MSRRERACCVHPATRTEYAIVAAMLATIVTVTTLVLLFGA